MQAMQMAAMQQQQAQQQALYQQQLAAMQQAQLAQQQAQQGQAQQQQQQQQAAYAQNPQYAQQMQMQQMQQQQMQQQQGGAGDAQGVGNEQAIMVSGCQHGTVGAIVRGTFTLAGENHGKPAYRKDQQVNGLDVMLYFWDERDGPNFCGWWFGPKIGGDQVWAYHASHTQTPPTGGWKVPYDGPVDPSFVIAANRGGMQQQQMGGYQQQAAAPQQNYQQQQQLQQQQQYQQQQQQYQQQMMQQKQQEAMRQQQMQAEQQRRMEEVRQQQEMLRRQQEQEKQRREAEIAQKRAEQGATLNIRRVIQKLRMVIPDNLEELKQELQAVVQSDLAACGSQAQRMQTEAEQAYQTADQRVAQIKEAMEKAGGLLQELEGLVESAEAEGKTLKAAAEPLSAEGDVDLKKVTAAAEKVEEAGAPAKEKMKACTDFILAKSTEIKAVDLPGMPPSEAKTKLADLLKRISETTRANDSTLLSAKTAKDKAVKKLEAQKKLATSEAVFTKYAKGGVIGKAEVTKYAQGEFSFKLPAATVEKIWKTIVKDGKGVKKEQFQALKVAVGVAREMGMDATRRAERLEREKKLAAAKEKMQVKIAAVAKKVEAAEATVGKAETETTDLLAKAQTETSAAMLALADSVDKVVQTGKDEIAASREAAEKLSEGLEDGLQAWLKGEVLQLEVKLRQFEPKLNKAAMTSSRFRELAAKKDFAEVNAFEKEAIAVIKHHAKAKSLDSDALFAAVGSDDKVTLKEFTAFFKTAERPEAPEGAPELTDEALSRVFAGLDDEEEGSLSKDKFLLVAKTYMKVVHESVITEGVSISDSKTLRRLDVGEVVEVLEGPTKPDDVEVMRVKAKTLKDEVVGWITTSGNQGTVFLEDGGNVYKIVQQTLMTDDFELDAAPKEGRKSMARKLMPGELVEVRAWPKQEKSGLTRMKCRAQSDGATGWVTTVGNQGTSFVQMA